MQTIPMVKAADAENVAEAADQLQDWFFSKNAKPDEVKDTDEGDALHAKIDSLMHIRRAFKDGPEQTGMILAFGGGIYLQIAASECMPKVYKAATTVQLRLIAFLAFFVGCLAIGLVLLDHKHCTAGGGHEGHNHGGGGGHEGHNH